MVKKLKILDFEWEKNNDRRGIETSVREALLLQKHICLKSTSVTGALLFPKHNFSRNTSVI